MFEKKASEVISESQNSDLDSLLDEAKAACEKAKPENPLLFISEYLKQRA
jgi:hypothetical protein